MRLPGEVHTESGPEPTAARCEDCLARVGMAPMVNKLERRTTMIDDYDTDEKLARLARVTAYAEELVEDDYLWFDASATYVREKFRTMLRLMGVDEP